MPYVADTNVYIRAANDPAFRARAEQFIREHGPIVVSGVVVAGILIGISDPASHMVAVRALTAAGAPLSPTAADWVRAGTTIARLGGDAVTKSRSFWNDTLLALQCSRLELTLVT